ncbi:enoyl-CoA hydratase/isomerase family protein, partial [Candidatus Hydrogenedentota bacterium]
GFAWELGPFEIWDALGVRAVVDRMESEDRQVPVWVKEMLETGRESFYGVAEKRRTLYDVAEKTEKAVPQGFRTLAIADQRLAGKVIRAGKCASIIDLDDGVLCYELHSKANAIGEEAIEVLHEAIALTEDQYEGLVVAARGPHFSVGADLSSGFDAMKKGRWAFFEEMVRNFQEAASALTYSHIPTVAAVQGRALGGGCETAIHCDRIQASREIYIGLTELAVGLVPAGGGCRQWAVRCAEAAAAAHNNDLFPHVAHAIMTVGMAEVSTSAAHARELGYLRSVDGTTRNRESLIYDAKMIALQLAGQGYRPPKRRKAFKVLGEAGVAEFKVRLNIFRQSGHASEYDEYLGNKVAFIICGGDVPANSTVDEQHILDLECETFLSLLGEPKTQARIMHTLKTGKPLRN